MNNAFNLVLIYGLMILSVQAQKATEVIPGNEWMPGWETSYDVISYQGDDLFFLINGGADLFMEYGFTDVAAVELNHPQKGTLYVEVYRMDSDSAAFGIFSIRNGSISIQVEPSPWVGYGEDFLHIWQGNYYVSASGSGLNEKQHLPVFLALTDYILKKVPADNILPLLYKQSAKSEDGKFTYLMGHLALNNVYSFGPDNIFSIREAMVINSEQGRQFVFNYKTPQQANEVYKEVLNYMQNTNRFSDFTRTGDGFEVIDRHGKKLKAYNEGNHIYVDLEK